MIEVQGAPTTASRFPSPVSHGGGWGYGILASPAKAGEVASLRADRGAPTSQNRFRRRHNSKRRVLERQPPLQIDTVRLTHGAVRTQLN